MPFATILALHKNNLVIHASDLPQGKGWSPMPWQIAEGRNDIVFTLFEAVAGVDAGLGIMTSNAFAFEWNRVV